VIIKYAGFNPWAGHRTHLSNRQARHFGDPQDLSPALWHSVFCLYFILITLQLHFTILGAIWWPVSGLWQSNQAYDKLIANAYLCAYEDVLAHACIYEYTQDKCNQDATAAHVQFNYLHFKNIILQKDLMTKRILLEDCIYDFSAFFFLPVYITICVLCLSGIETFLLHPAKAGL